MLNIRSILCPVDFSDASRQALHWAAAIASEWRSQLTVVTAVDPLLAEAARARFARDLVKEDVEPALRDFVDAVPAGPDRGAGTTLVAEIGDPASVALAAAGRVGADLIVMGTHGLSGLKKIVLGSTAERVLRKTTIPVLAVTASEAGARIAEGAGRRVLQIEAVLAATDFSDAAIRATGQAAAIAQRLNARLILAHVVTPLSVPGEFQQYVLGVDEQVSADARAQLEAQGRTLPVAVQTEIVVEIGRPADRISSIARDRGAGLIVMGLTSEKDANAVRPGAIAYPVVWQSHVPVMVVPL
jgi:nucleotide-binding universal stress UspA family protein